MVGNNFPSLNKTNRINIMGQKIKHRHSKLPKRPRNWEARDMILNKIGRGGPHSDKRDRRDQRQKQWEKDLDFPSQD